MSDKEYNLNRINRLASFFVLDEVDLMGEDDANMLETNELDSCLQCDGDPVDCQSCHMAE